jgi:hypothetical protein
MVWLVWSVVAMEFKALPARLIIYGHKSVGGLSLEKECFNDDMP